MLELISYGLTLLVSLVIIVFCFAFRDEVALRGKPVQSTRPKTQTCLTLSFTIETGPGAVNSGRAQPVRPACMNPPVHDELWSGPGGGRVTKSN